MKVFSKTHTITAQVGAAVKPVLGPTGKPLPKTAVINHEVGTVLELPDESAQDLVDRGVAEEYKPDEHKDEPDGVVSVTTIADRVLADGQAHPSDVRQDGTLNDGTALARPAGPTIIRDAKNDAAVQADRDAALKSDEQKAAEAKAVADAAAKAAADAAAKAAART